MAAYCKPSCYLLKNDGTPYFNALSQKDIMGDLLRARVMDNYTTCAIYSIIAASILSISILHPNIAVAEGKDPIYGELVQKSLDLKIQCTSGLTVDMVSDCPASDRCVSLRHSGNNLLECIPSFPLNNLNVN